jgi:hypothetical protein
MRYAVLMVTRNSLLGAHVLRNMTPVAQAARLVDGLIMMFAARLHSVRAMGLIDCNGSLELRASSKSH